MGKGGNGGSEPAKLLLPFLQRADELQKHDLLVAYYCRLYAMERGLKIPSKERSKTTNELLLSVMNQLEKDKKHLKFNPDDHLHVEGFALAVFNKADKQDRSGRADLNTAKSFYAASIFFEVLTQFGDPQPEIEQKQKYAIWKAADIRKAISEGRKPQPGPPGGEEGFSLDSIPDENPPPEHSPAQDASQNFGDGSQKYGEGMHSYGAGSGYGSEFPSGKTTDYHAYSQPTAPAADFHPPTSFTSPTTDFPSYKSQHTPDADFRSSEADYRAPTADFRAAAPQAPEFQRADFHRVPSTYTAPAPTELHSYGTAAPASYHQTSSYASYPSSFEAPMRTSSAPPPAPVDFKPTPEVIAEAHKASRFAVSALAFDDVPTAISYLRRSLELLTTPSPTKSV